MQIDVINRMEDFQKIKDDWLRVYRSDTSAQIYLSWEWMAQWLPLIGKQWFILAAKESPAAKQYVAFFPLRARTHMASQGGFFTELAMAGNRFADYTGLICAHRFRRSAITAFGKHLSAMNCAIINFESVRLPERDLKRLIRCFPSGKFTVESCSMVDAESGIDNSICPFAELPNDWDDYLSGLSSNTRQKIRRLMRKVDQDETLRLSFATADTIEHDIDSLLQFWALRWAETKGKNADVITKNLRAMLERSFDCGILWLPVLYHENKAVGVHGVLVDDDKKVLNFVVGSRDPGVTNPQPGLALHAHTIQYGISQGFRQYDFLRGNEPYKYSFGCQENRIFRTLVKRKGRGARRNLLDRHSIPETLERVHRLQAEGKEREAEIGYRQILDVDGSCAVALYGFGTLKIAQGEPAVAEKAFRKLIGMSSMSNKAWLALANSLAAQNRWTEAEKARQFALNLTPPKNSAMYH